MGGDKVTYDVVFDDRKGKESATQIRGGTGDLDAGKGGGKGFGGGGKGFGGGGKGFGGGRGFDGGKGFGGGGGKGKGKSNGYKIYVAGLSYDTTNAGLRECFSSAGEIIY